MIKKILSIVLSLTMILTIGMASTSAVAETVEPTITLESIEAEAGQDVSVKVFIENNPGIWGIDLKISYDKSTLSLTSVENGDFFQSAEWTQGKLDADVYILSYEASGFDNITTKSGTLATLNFTVSDNASAGDYSINASYNVGDIINVDFDDISFNILNGRITVKSKPISVTDVQLSTNTLSLKSGESEDLIATVIPNTATNKAVTWKSNNDSVATVQDGTVYAHKKGTATITVTTVDGEYTDECVVTVACSHTNTTVIPAKDSTCLEQGNDSYTVCNDCGEIIFGTDEKLPLGSHTYVETVDEKYLVSPATCIMRATYYKSCSVCGEPSSETFESGEVNTSNHVGDTYVVKQKEATCYEEGYTGDIKCSSCNATITPGKAIPQNEHNPADVWSTNDTHHWKVCQTVGCGNIIDMAEHSGGEATCTQKAICSVCHVQYGNLNPDNHKNTEIRNATNPTCSQDGYSGDTWCVDCQKQIGTGHSIPSTGKHVDADGEWESNATQHFHTCACGVEFDQEDHKGGEATCSAKAICDVCKSEYGDFNANNHKGSTYIEGQKEATCYEEGYTGDTYCSDCRTKIESGTVIPKNAHNPADVWSTNDTHHWKECQTVGCGNIIDKKEHSGGNATCKNKAICSVCGVEYGDLNSENHVGETEVKDVVEATCTTDGFTGNTYCKDCGAKIKNGDVIPAAHTLQKIDAKAATHYADGNIEYYVCTVCGAYFSDAAAENEITFDDTVIEKGEHEYVEKYDDEGHWKECECGSVTDTEKHTFGDWVITQNVTASENGSREKVCTVCGYKITEEIPVPSGDGDTSNSGTQQNNDGSAGNNKSNDSTSSPQTGDSSDIVLWIVLLAMSGFALVGASLFKRKRIK